MIRALANFVIGSIYWVNYLSYFGDSIYELQINHFFVYWNSRFRLFGVTVNNVRLTNHKYVAFCGGNRMHSCCLISHRIWRTLRVVWDLLDYNFNRLSQGNGGNFTNTYRNPLQQYYVWCSIVDRAKALQGQPQRILYIQDQCCYILYANILTILCSEGGDSWMIHCIFTYYPGISEIRLAMIVYYK